MIREEAKRRIEILYYTLQKKFGDFNEFDKEAINMAIKALSVECEDVISRQAVLEEMEKRHKEGDCITKGFINKLPSVMPKKKMFFDGMTNGEVIQALFPKAEVYVQEWKGFKSIVVWFENAQVSHDFTWDWWNTPYESRK